MAAPAEVFQGSVLKLVTYNQVKTIVEDLNLDRARHEVISSDNAYSRVLAENIVVTRNVPDYDIAAIDGYAVSSIRTKSAKFDAPISCQVIDEVYPDDGNVRSIEPRQAVYVACGARIPHGADCVIKFEQVKRAGDRIQVFSPFATRKNICYKGEDFKAGSTLFKANHILRPQDVGALISVGRRFVKVLVKPLVGVLSVGNELIEAKKISDRRIPNDHAYVILGFLQDLGVERKNLGVCPDDESKIAARLIDGLNKCDMVITLGGCSVGKKDIVPRVIANLPGARMLFHGIRVSPGKVAGLSIVENKPIVMLAGHIVTAAAGFFMVALPIIKRMIRFHKHHKPGTISARLTEDIKTKLGMARFLFARIEYQDGDLTSQPFGFETNLLSNLVAANSYTLVPENSDVRAGETLSFHCLNQREPVLA